MDQFDLHPAHFLSLPRPDSFISHLGGVVDTTTLAAHDFDVDTRTGFMPPEPPLERLPAEWDAWESVLREAMDLGLQLGDKPGLSEGEKEKSRVWRGHVRELNILPIDELKKSEVLLRRAHHVLAWIMHFYIHSLPPTEPIIIPAPITLPLLQICQQLQLPPVLTYSDDVLYNWALVKTPNTPGTPGPIGSSMTPTQQTPGLELDNLRCITLFTGTPDEQEFYLTSARMELRGVEALELMRATMDEAFVGDDIAIKRITGFLLRLSPIIEDLKDLLVGVRRGCDPEVFYRDIRPWFRGVDSGTNTGTETETGAETKRIWEFEGIERDPTLVYPVELSGPSAGQSSLIHALDIFLGVEQYSHETSGKSSPSTPTPTPTPTTSSHQSFLTRMQTYMPRHHRSFLTHLKNNPRPLRSLVAASRDSKLTEAFNAAVGKMKELRDAHFRIVAVYIVGPAARERREREKELVMKRMKMKGMEGMEGQAREDGSEERNLKGTGGSDLVKFLKDVRDGTARAVLPLPLSSELSL